MKARLVLAAAAAVLMFPAAASAATVAVEGGVLRLDSTADAVDAEVWQDGGDVHLYDYLGTLEPGDGCAEEPQLYVGIPPWVAFEIVCSGPVTAIDAKLGDRGNGLYLGAALPITVVGGAEGDFIYAGGSGAVLSGGSGDDGLYTATGDDTVDAGPGDDSIYTDGGADRLAGGDGDDSLQADPAEITEEDFVDCRARSCARMAVALQEPAQAVPGGADVLDGGPGNDSLEGGAGRDQLLPGDGRDTVVYHRKDPVTIALDGPAGEDDTLRDAENVRTGRGADTVTGNAASNEIVTSEGNDTVDAGAGIDKVDTAAGDDVVHARDGAADDVDCGEGGDRVIADPEDAVNGSCETVERAAFVTATAPSTVAPTRLAVSAARVRRALVVRGQIALPAGTDPSTCSGGGVSVRVRGVGRRGTTLDQRCRFSVRFARARRGRLNISASFAGTPRLGPISATRVVKVR